MSALRARGQAGFTLLEILVALVVFGLLMAGLSQAMHFGLRAWQTELRGTAGPEDLAAGDDALRRLIEQALPGSMTGNADRLAFTTWFPSGSPAGDGLADVTLRRDAAGLLVLSWVAHPAGIPLRPAARAQRETLAAGVQALSLAYLTAAPDGSLAWRERWQGPGLPLLVRLSRRLSGQPGWPDLVAAPTAAGP